MPTFGESKTLHECRNYRSFESYRRLQCNSDPKKIDNVPIMTSLVGQDSFVIFADVSGPTRPIECVISDEGFGSLDKEGLRAAEELNRLKRHLKRIILVSPQHEFTNHFTVVIQLKKTDDG